MNSVLLSLVVLLALTNMSTAIVCTPALCEGAKCTTYTEENCAGKVVEKGGFCGCCDACYGVLNKGDDCGPYPLLGVPRYAVCADGLTCSDLTGKC
ncbi:unnamed protein product, partial [Candidula unifasciata]